MSLGVLPKDAVRAGAGTWPGARRVRRSPPAVGAGDQVGAVAGLERLDSALQRCSLLGAADDRRRKHRWPWVDPASATGRCGAAWPACRSAKLAVAAAESCVRRASIRVAGAQCRLAQSGGWRDFGQDPRGWGCGGWRGADRQGGQGSAGGAREGEGGLGQQCGPAKAGGKGSSGNLFRGRAVRESRAALPGATVGAGPVARPEVALQRSPIC